MLIEAGMVQAETQPRTAKKKKTNMILPRDEITLDIEDLRVLIEKFYEGNSVWDELSLESKIKVLLRERIGAVHPHLK